MGVYTLLYYTFVYIGLTRLPTLTTELLNIAILSDHVRDVVDEAVHVRGDIYFLEALAFTSQR